MKSIFVVFTLLWAIAIGAFVPESTWENVRYERSINLGKAYSREHIKYEIKNLDSKPNQEYFIGIPNYLYEKLSLFSVGVKGSKETLQSELLPAGTSTNLHEHLSINYIKVKLPQPIAPKQSFEFELNLVITDCSSPLPAKLEMGQEQTLLLQTYKLPISSYKTLKSSLKITGVTEAKELKYDDQAIEYASEIIDEAMVYDFNNDEFKPFSVSKLNLLYKHNLPIPKVSTLKRDIWISHWGSTLQFEEFYKLTNNAAGLKNGFSRVEFLANKLGSKVSSCLAAIELHLTDNAKDIYYTDLVGNVSTSRVFNDKFYIKPRYPIFGGWNYNFTLGWSNDLREYLRDLSNDEYLIAIPLLNGPVDTTYDEVRFSVYLPEGAEFLDVLSPIEFEDQVDEFEKSYFDLENGHVKRTLVFKNLVDEFAHLEILVKYRYTKWALIKKPLNIAKYVFVALISYLVLSKIDLSLESKKK